MAACDPEETFPHYPKTGLSVREHHRFQWAGRTACSNPQHMRVDHGCGYVRMPQQLLHCSDIGACMQQVGGERMAQGSRKPSASRRRNPLP